MARTPARKSTATYDREQMIAQAAYLRAEKRGFQGGDPVADWLEAEAEVDALIAKRPRRTPAKKDEYLEKLKTQLVAGSEQLEKLRPKLARLRSEARTEWERELLRLDQLRDNLATQTESLRRKGEKKRTELKAQAEKVLQEFKAGLERLSSRFNK